MNKTYLGDGAYVELVDYSVKLTTSDGVRDTNEIFMEPEVIRVFLEYLKFIGMVK